MRIDAPRSEFAANLEIRRDPRAPIVGATFHHPAPRRARQAPRLTGRACIVGALQLVWIAFLVIMLAGCGGGDPEPEAAPDVQTPAKPAPGQSI